jgi:hypothetical protein
MVGSLESLALIIKITLKGRALWRELILIIKNTIREESLERRVA